MRKKQIHKTLTRLVLYLILGCLTCAVTAQDVENNRTPVYATTFVSWAPDSQTLYIEEHNSNAGSLWKLYTLSTQAVTPFDQSLPLTIEQQLLTQQIAPLLDGVRVYLSPNMEFAVYNTIAANNNYFSLALVNLLTGQVVLFDNIRPQSPYSTFAFETVWSTNSRAFYIKINRSTSISYVYFTNYSADLTTVEVVYVTADINDEIDGGVEDIYDIDRNGRFLLLDTYQSQTGGQSVSSLILMDMRDLSYLVISHDYSFANFEHTNDEHINYLSGVSVYQYNRSTALSRLRNANIGVRHLDKAKFSPDGRHVVLAALDDDLVYKYIYVLEIEPTPPPEGR